jgi:hypothetical protein
MATKTSNTSGNWSVGATWVGGVKPADNDSVVIAAGHNILMDDDLSAYTGLQSVTISGHATTPGMLYWKDGTSGTLKLRTGYTIMGTNFTYKGRLLVNSDGVWGNTGALAFSSKAIILFDGTAQVNGNFLEARVYCAEPTRKFVRMYFNKFTVSSIDTGTNVITMGSAHGWSANRPVSVKSSGTLPAPLEADAIYFVGSPSGADLKLLYKPSGTEVDLTSSGSGTIEIYSGYETYSGVTTVNVLDDVTADTPWTTTAGHNQIALVDAGPSDFDQQRLTLSTITSTTMTLSTALDSIQYPGAMIFLSSRNVSFRSSSTTTSQSVFVTISNSIINAEVKNTAGTSTTFYGNGFGTTSNFNTIGGVLFGLLYGLNASHSNTVTGNILVSGTGIGNANNNIVSGIIAGCSTGLSNSRNTLTSTGVIIGCATGVGGLSGNVISGLITKCNTGITGVFNNLTQSGKVSGCTYGLGYLTGEVYGVLERNTNEYTFGTLAVHKALIRNASMSPDSFYSRNPSNYMGGRFCIENYNRTDGVHKIFDAFGDILKTACDGTGDAPSVDPDGGNGACVEASNIQSFCGAGPVGYQNNLRIIDGMRIWLTAEAHTVTFKLQTTYAGITAGNLKLTCQYIGTDGAITETTNAPAISQRSADTDWSQTLAVTFTPTQDGWATFRIDLMEYESGNEVYVWPVPAVT